MRRSETAVDTSYGLRASLARTVLVDVRWSSAIAHVTRMDVTGSLHCIICSNCFVDDVDTHDINAVYITSSVTQICTH